MPVRVLDRLGEGDSVAISAGIRYAAAHGARGDQPLVRVRHAASRAAEIPDILAALRYARRKGALVVGAAGNGAAHAVAYPARASDVLSVGATTEHLCLADYSNSGAALDIVAPGGGRTPTSPATRTAAPAPARRARHLPDDLHERLACARFGLPGGYMGTSMAAPHVGRRRRARDRLRRDRPEPVARAIEARLKATARDLGPPGRDSRYGGGLVDAARAGRRR